MRSGWGSAVVNAVFVFVGQVRYVRLWLGCCACVCRSGRVMSGHGLAAVLVFVDWVM